MALRDNDIDLTKEYNPSDNTLENGELNSTRFKQSYVSFLDLLYNLYPNAYGTQLLVRYGLPSELTEEVPNLSADKLDWMLDVDHFAKDIKIGTNGYDLSKPENREHFVKLFKTAVALFSSEDKLKMALPDFGDTSISKENGGSTITYGKDFLLSNMDSRYSDMKFYGKETGEVDADGNKLYEEVNSFSFDKLNYTDADKTNLINFARIFDINNDGLIGTDDAVLILVAYAYFLALKDSTYKDIITYDTAQTITKEYVNSSYLGDFDEHKGANLLTKNSYTQVTGNEYIEKGTDRVYYFYQSKNNTNVNFNVYNPKTGLVEDDNNKISVQLYLSNSSTKDDISSYLVSKANALEKIRQWGLFSTLQFKNKNSAESFNSEISVFILRIIARKHNYTKQYITVEEFAEELAKIFKLGNLKTEDFVDSNGNIVNKNGNVYIQGSGTNTESVAREGWNESINGLYSLLKEWSKNYGLTPRDGIDTSKLVKELKEADAKGDGDNDETLLHPIPFTNLLKQNYKQARRDEIKQNDIFMDYTNRIESADEEGKIKIIKEVMNLIMPAYKRRVEVEDLDKNFWVISTVVGSIVDVLFGNDGLRGILKGQTAELMELWNNIKYLWNIIDVQAKMINDLALANASTTENDTDSFVLKKNLYEYKTIQQLNSKDLLNMSAELLDLNGDGYINDDDVTLLLQGYASSMAQNLSVSISWNSNVADYPMVGTFTYKNKQVLRIGLALHKVTYNGTTPTDSLIKSVNEYIDAITNKTSADNFYRTCKILEFNDSVFNEVSKEVFDSTFTSIDETVEDTYGSNSSSEKEHISLFYRSDTGSNWFKVGLSGNKKWEELPIGGNKGYFCIPPSTSEVYSYTNYDLVYYDNNGKAESLITNTNKGAAKKFLYSRLVSGAEPQYSYIQTHLNAVDGVRISPKLKRCSYQISDDDKYKSFNFIFCRNENIAPKREIEIPASSTSNKRTVDLIYREEDDESVLREKFFLKYIFASFWYASAYQEFKGILDSKMSVAMLKMLDNGNYRGLSNTEFNDIVYKKFYDSLVTIPTEQTNNIYKTSELSSAQLNMLMEIMENEKGQHYDISYSSIRRLVTVESQEGKLISNVTILQDENSESNKEWANNHKNLPYIPNSDMILDGQDARITLNDWTPDYKVGDPYPSSLDNVEV